MPHKSYTAINVMMACRDFQRRKKTKMIDRSDEFLDRFEETSLSDISIKLATAFDHCLSSGDKIVGRYKNLIKGKRSSTSIRVELVLALIEQMETKWGKQEELECIKRVLRQHH